MYLHLGKDELYIRKLVHIPNCGVVFMLVRMELKWNSKITYSLSQEKVLYCK